MEELLHIAVVGVTGLVGKKLLEILQERGIDANYCFYASKNSSGKTLTAFNKKYKVHELCEKNIKNKHFDYALFAVESTVAEIFVPLFVEAGATVIDNSSAFRSKPWVPLVVPEVNFDAIKEHHKIIANPNCSTIQAVVALAPLHKKYKIKRIVYSTYQAVSGAGQAGLDDLINYNAEPQRFPHKIYNNILPHIDAFESDGYTKEEHKMINETRKILGDYKIKITATAVRVPVLNSHSESINVQFKKRIHLKAVTDTLQNAQGVVVIDDTENNKYPMPVISNGRDEVFAGRFRIDKSHKNTLNMWVVADNLRKGAATNAVQILERLLERRPKA